MPIINESSINEKLSKFTPYDHETMRETEFSEVFGASLGVVIDEELSVSAMLNREGWAQRKVVIDEMIRSGEIGDVSKYRGKGTVSINYDSIAKDLKREDIKTDEQLRQERNAMLKSRREYAEDIVSRGSGSAQFLGAMNAYMVDPVNILTIGVAAPATGAKAAGTLARVALATRNAALIEGAAEIGIQTMVYQHKQDIDSPYGASDALANIAMAATGAGILSGVTEGISGWLKSTLDYAEKLPQTDEIVTAKSYLQRQQQMLNGANKIDMDAAKDDFLLQAKKDISEALDEISPENIEKIQQIKLDINRMENGEIPESMKKAFDEHVHKKQIESDVQYLQEMDNRSRQYALPSKYQKAYQSPTVVDDVNPSPPPAAASQRERDILRAQGLDETFDAEMARFDRIENKFLEIDGERFDPVDLVKQYDDEIQGLDSVLQCAYGAGQKSEGKLMSAFVGAFNAK